MIALAQLARVLCRRRSRCPSACRPGSRRSAGRRRCTSIIANSSATRVGGLYSASELPITQIAVSVVRRASDDGDQVGRRHQAVAVGMMLVHADRVEAAFGGVFELVHEVVVHVDARASGRTARSGCRPRPTDCCRGNRPAVRCRASGGTTSASWTVSRVFLRETLARTGQEQKMPPMRSIHANWLPRSCAAPRPPPPVGCRASRRRMLG